MRRWPRIVRWALLALAVAAAAAIANVALLASIDDSDEPVGNLRPVLVGPATLPGAAPPRTATAPPETVPATETTDATGDDDRSGREGGERTETEPNDERGRHGSEDDD